MRLLYHLLTWVALAACAACAKTIDAFRYADERTLAATWRPGLGAPVPQRSADGATFLLPFDGGRDRVYWDRDVKLDLSRYTSIEIEVTIDRPEAVRTLMIYFKSGDGWYVWGGPLKLGGRQRLSLPKAAFSIEGKPDGWNRIERIRLSPWRGTPIAARLTAHKIEARVDGIRIIRATVSAPNPAERTAAQRAADRVSRWLSDAGIRHAVISEDALSAAAIEGCRVLILPYNAKPSAAHLELYKKHISAGGRLIVCFSDSDALAELMGVTLGETITHREAGRFAGFVFHNSGEFHVPERVYQQSWGLRVAHPRAGRGRVIAHWFNAAGERHVEPAWLATDAGFWMTHIPLDDDRDGKERLFVGLVGALAPSAWTEAAQEAYANAGKVDGYGSFFESAENIRRLAIGHPARAGIHALLEEAENEMLKLERLYAAARYPEVFDQARFVRRLLTMAYSRAQRAPDGELRAVWDHDAVGWYPGDWDRTMRELKASGINTLFVNTLWAGLAHYPSRHVPSSHTSRRFGDQMKAAIDAGRRHGVSVHAWVVLWNVGNAPPEFVDKLRRENRLQQDFAGVEVMWLNPALPENRRHILAAIEELGRKYAPDGIHLDYVRYPSAQACFSRASQIAFEKWLGRSMGPWPASVRSGPRQAEYRRWRASVITDFVRETRRAVRNIDPNIRLSAAVWGGYPEIINSIGQDWGLWLREGLLDFVTPMNYSDDSFRFLALTQKQLALPNAQGRIYPGIGVVSAESQLRADQVVEQIAIARRLGAPGFALYKLSQTLRNETLPLLREGATR